MVTFVDNVNTKAVAASTVAGAGPYPTLSGGCKTSGGRSAAGASSANGFSAEFSMGKSSLEGLAPSLEISASVAATNLATPVGLVCDTNDPNVEVIQSGSGIRQVKAPQALADVVTLDGYSYEIRYYLPSQVGSKVGGVYTLVGSPTPFVTWKVQNPDASTTIYNRIRITETRGSDVRTYESTNSVGTSDWQIGYPANLVENDQTTTIDTNGMSTYFLNPSNNLISATGYKRTVITRTKVPGGADQVKTKRVYQRFA